MRFLENVKDKKEIVPFKRYNRGVGRKAQVHLDYRPTKLVFVTKAWTTC